MVRSPESDILRLLVVMVITAAALSPAAVAVGNTTVSDSNSTMTGSETGSTTSSEQYTTINSSHTTQHGISTNASNSATSATATTSVQTTLSVAPTCLTLFVGMAAKTKLHVNITTTSNSSLLTISVANGTDVFELEGDQLVLNRTLTVEALYRINITTQEDMVELLVRVESLQIEQPTYLAEVPENMDSQHCILDMTSNAERHGVPVVYSLASGSSMFSINSSTGVVCVEAALDGDVQSEHLLNVSLHLSQGNVAHGADSSNDTDQVGATRSFLVRVEAQKDKTSSLGNIGRELILSVPEHVNESFVIATFKGHNSKQGLNAVTQYSLTNESEIFSVADGQLRVEAPDRLKDRHVFKVTVKAAHVNRTSNAAYLDVKIFVVKDVNDFILPAKLPAAILRHNSQFFLQELANILGLRLTLVNVSEHEQTDSSDSDRSELVFKAFEINSNDSIHVNASEIGTKIAEKYGTILTMFGYFDRFFNSTYDDVLNSALNSDNNNNDYTLNSLSKILIAVICLLLLILIVTIITARRLWRSCCRQKNNLSDEDPLAMDNWSFSGKTHRKSTSVSDIFDNIDKSETKSTNQSELNSTRQPKFTTSSQLDFSSISQPKFTTSSQLDFISTREPMFPSTSESQDSLMSETHQKTFYSDTETRSLGLNTVARREHVRDQQMEKLQQLFQALGDDVLYSKNNLYPNLEKEKYEGDVLSKSSDKQDILLFEAETGVSESGNRNAAETISSDPDISKLKTPDSATSRTPLYLSIFSVEDGKKNLVTSQQHEGLQQKSTPESDTVRAVEFPQISDRAVEFPQISDRAVVSPQISDGTDVLPRKSNFDVTNHHPPFEESKPPHTLSDITDNREDEQNVLSINVRDQNNDLQPDNPVKSYQAEESFALLYNANPDVPNEQTEGETNSRWAFPSDTQNMDSPDKKVLDGNSPSEDVQEQDSHGEDVQEQDSPGEDVLDLDVLVAVSAEDIVTHF